MAQGAVASLPANGTTLLTDEDVHEILECEKIVRFSNAVLSGTHPRIKVPPHMVGKQSRSNRRPSPPIVPALRANPPRAHSERNAVSTMADEQLDEGNHLNNNNKWSTSDQRRASGWSAGAGPTMANAAKSEIDPILLEKSENLIKAELQLQRQHLERALREQIEQRRAAVKASLQTSESLPDFDLSDVLSKALTIVHPSTVVEVEQVGVHTSASDSFDENTFYSSQHDTPEHSSSAQEQREPAEIPLQIVTTDAHSVGGAPGQRNDESRDMLMSAVHSSDAVDPLVQSFAHKKNARSHGQISDAPASPLLAGRSSAARPEIRQIQPSNVIEGGVEDSHSVNVSVNTGHSEFDLIGANSGMNRQEAAALVVQAGLKHGLEQAMPESIAGPRAEPVIRSFNLSPIAPQPARVSPLATARAPPLIDQSMAMDQPSPIQVAALSKPTSSPESSPKGSKLADKKKGKKKKGRKSGSGNKSGAIDTPDSPYIKPEPRSPSPLTAAPLPRPHKRQRQTFNLGQELNYDEPRYEVPRDEPHDGHSTSHYRESRGQAIYGRSDDEQMYEIRDSDRSGQRPAHRDESQYRRIVSREAYRAPQSPGMYAVPYIRNEARPLRAASHMVVERHAQEHPRHFREPYIPQRATTIIDVDRERSRSPRRSPILMAPPPRIPSSRIVVDEFGRQYYMPVPAAAPPLSRQSAAPQMRLGEEDYAYERPPLRTLPRSSIDVFEEDGVVYRRASPQYVAPRRIVTQTEQEAEYRPYRQRDYSTRPLAMGPASDEYVRVREPAESRHTTHFEELPRELARVGSVRPEPPRYEIPRNYVSRGQSVRPEVLGQMPSSRHDMRSEIPAPRTVREISVRPAGLEAARREYIPHSDGGYTAARPVTRRVLDGGTEYIERPRDAPHDMYTDEVRRPVNYR